MKLEDALFYMVIDAEIALDPIVPELCCAAIAGGVDIIRMDCAGQDQAKTEHMAGRIVEVCRAEDALFIVGNNVEIAAAAKADGVHFSSIESSIGMARSCLDVEAIVGLSSTSTDEASLAVEVGADYVLHQGGTASPSVFRALNGAGGVPLFADGIAGQDDVRELVDAGVYRFCIDSNILGRDNITEQAAEFSRILGRCM
ncbi:MAG: thiamine phosphate synthase [Kiritimatiellae bacterium]|nr:thiamine phosphate synthase [Kiritimatiellia bacterium]